MARAADGDSAIVAVRTDDVDSAVAAIGRAGTELHGLAVGLTRIHEFHEVGNLNLNRFLGTGVKFKSHVLPKSVATMATLKDILEYYMSMEFDDWLECLPLLRDEAERSHKLAKEISNEYQCLLQVIDGDLVALDAVVQQQQQSAEHFLQCEQKALQVKDQAQSKAVVADKVKYLAAGAVIGVLAANPVTWGAGVLALSATAVSAGLYGEDQREQSEIEFKAARKSAIDMQQSADEKKQLVKCLDDDIVRSLRQFNKTMREISGFFANMMSEINTFTSGVTDEGLTRAVTDGETRRAKMHYLKLRGKSRLIHDTCSNFIAAVPAMKSAMRCVPDEVDELRIQYVASQPVSRS